MAVQAPFHLQRLRLVHQRHAIDAAVTGFAAHALADVDAVIEVHEIRQVVHADPVERPIVAEAGADRFEVRAVRPDLRVAVDAGLGGRNAGRRRHLHRRMAIPAVDADAARVMLVTELDRLLDELIRRRDDVRSLKRENHPAEAEHQQKQRDQAGSRPGVGAFWEYLRHAFLRSCDPRGRGTTSAVFRSAQTNQLYAQ